MVGLFENWNCMKPIKDMSCICFYIGTMIT